MTEETKPVAPDPPRKMSGDGAFLFASILWGVGASGVFSISGWWRALPICAVVTGGIWAWNCIDASRQERSGLREANVELERELERAVENARKEHRSEVADAVGAMFEHLQSVAHLPRKDGNGEGIVKECLESLAKLMGGKSPRAVLYAPVFAEDDGDPDEVDQSTMKNAIGSPARLELVGFRGRTSDAPRDTFLRADDDLHGMITVFDTGDVQEIPGPDTVRARRILKGKRYQAFTNVRTGIGTTPNGVLSVDTCTPHSLDSSHVDLMQVFGLLLAVGIHRRKRALDQRGQAVFRSVRDRVRPGEAE